MVRKTALLVVVLLVAAAAVVAVDAPKATTGTVKAPAGVDLQLKSSAGSTVTVTGGTDAALAPGAYTIADARVLKRESREEKGKKVETTWMVASKGPFGKLSPVKVVAGETVALDLGESLLMKTDASASDSGVSIGLAIVGKAGESYSPVVNKDGKPQAAPKLQIVDQSGKVLDSGSFQFG